MHTVPAGYLVPFGVTDDRELPGIWQYSRTSEIPRLIGIYDAAVRKDIYAFEDGNGQRNEEIEALFCEAEGKFWNVRDDVLAKQLQLNIDQRISLARYIAEQLLRTQRSLQLHRDGLAHLLKWKVLELAEDRHGFHKAMRQAYESDNDCEDGIHHMNPTIRAAGGARIVEE